MSASRQLGLLWGLVALTLVALSPLAATLAASVPACAVKSIAGVPCPSCGTTRATLALAALDPWAALALNPLVTVAWIGVILGGFLALAISMSGRELPSLPRRLPLSLRLAAVALVAANWLYLVVAGV